ncbi:MAG: hypothetical protein IJU89_03455 [Alphaproteobacteria bacterium]|nr:hypothetical protein [Alphaproteobacteria bacterium]
MYYKIVTPQSFFTDLYDGNINIDVFDIPCETVFTAPNQSKHRPDDPKCMVNNSCFHFAQGAFDTMLWHTKLAHHLLDARIYQIQPLTDVIKQRCQDSTGIYQCGAHKIKILEKQNIHNMYELAIQEYYTDFDRYKNFKINIDRWKKHQPTVFLLYQCYR